MTGPVPVPACPPPAQPAPAGILPGELCRWRIHGTTITLRQSDGRRWLELHTRHTPPLDPDQTADLLDTLEAAWHWQHDPQAEPDPEPQQTTLWEAAS